MTVKGNWEATDLLIVKASNYYKDLKKRFADLHRQNYTYSAISGALGVTVRTLTSWREDIGLPRRPRGRRSRRKS
jgi:hypothetical protein